MEQEILKNVGKNDWKDMEMQLAFHCAPLIAGLKLSNLLMVQGGEMDRMKNMLKRTGISYFVVTVIRGKAAVLLFDREKLEQYIWEEKVWEIFQYMGYQERMLGRILYAFRLRYEGYLMGKSRFPHEIGLLLGYPVEDVKGFIINEGANCLYTGYWKVYENPSEKKLLFREFERARDTLLALLSDGMGIVEIIQGHLLTKWIPNSG